MPASKKPSKAKAAPRKAGPRKDVPQIFRLNIEVGDLEQAASFYGSLLGIEGRRQAGSRVYFQAGPVTLQVVDVSSSGRSHPAAKALYFTVRDLEAIFERARALGCLSPESVHDAPGGGIVVRPWGESPSTSRIPGRTPCASSRKGPCTRAEGSCC